MSRQQQKLMQDFFLSSPVDEDTDFIPLISEEDDESITMTTVPDTLPILPLRNTVLFPGVIIPITVGRNKSMKLVRDFYQTTKIIGTIAQKDPNKDDPEASELHKVGTVAQLLRILEMPDGSTSVIIQGKKRFSVDEVISTEPYYTARVHGLNDVKPKRKDPEFEAIVGSLKDLASSSSLGSIVTVIILSLPS